MNWYPCIKSYYEEGRYTTEDLKVFLQAKQLTPEQYQQLTGEAPPKRFSKPVSLLKRTLFSKRKTS